MDETHLEASHNIKGVFAGAWNPALTEGKDQVKTFYLLWTFVMDITSIFLILILLFGIFPLLCSMSLR